MQDAKTVNDAFLRLSGRGEKTAWLWQTKGGEWKPISAAEVYGRVRAMAKALAAWGVGKGDRVALVSENRWEWQATDFAALALGAVDVPLYPTLTAEQLGYMLRDSGAKVVVVSSRAQYDKVKAAGELPALEHLVVMDEGEFEGAESFAELMVDAEKMQARDAAFDEGVRAVRPEDVATIIYTSGTTGEPKGVMLTHGNLASNFTLSTRPFGFSEKDSCISFLPLSHVTARHLDLALMYDGAVIAYCPKIDRLAPAMAAVKPTIIVAVPRVYEKVRQGVERKSGASAMKKKIFEWALGVGRANRDAILKGRQPGEPLWVSLATVCCFALVLFDGLTDVVHGHRALFLVVYLGFVLLFCWTKWRWAIANKLVFSKIRGGFGGRVKTFVSGGAPLGMDTAGWFADVGIRVFEGYGLTETSPVIALNEPERHRIGSVGPVIGNIEVRLAEDGELEVRGPSIFKGYWNKPAETAAVFTPDGFFCTGDIAKLEDGFLWITDRKKELIKTSNGKFIAPQPIENKLKANTLVGTAALVGDRQKFVAALISPNFAALEDWAKAQGIAAGDRATLVKDAKVVAEYKAIVDKVNKMLAPFELIKRVCVVGEEWSVETDELTPSMKLKRRVVQKRYAAEIRGFYGDEGAG